jgi:SAM-dependent methyltransferase
VNFFANVLTLFLCAATAHGFAQAQGTNENFHPAIGLAGKDVIWIPTPQALVEKMLDVARVTPNDYVIDLGSGDGRLVITAAKRGARALGIEYNPEMVELSKRNAANEGVSDRATFLKADLFESDLSQATVITIFLRLDLNLKLRPRLLDLKPGTRIVSNSFSMGEWSADQIVIAEDSCVTYCTAYFWLVPAKIAGRWQMAEGELTLRQSFQLISGAIRSSGHATEIANGRLEGNQISFTAGDTRYIGRVNGNSMEGTVSSGGYWKATRSGN